MFTLLIDVYLNVRNSGARIVALEVQEIGGV